MRNVLNNVVIDAVNEEDPLPIFYLDLVCALFKLQLVLGFGVHVYMHHSVHNHVSLHCGRYLVYVIYNYMACISALY